MASVGSSNTGPEIALRKALFSIGVRGWRCNVKDLPGTPDIVFRKARLAIFVDGAFWHGHPSKYWKGRSGEYWDAKIQRNIERDRRVDESLKNLGWRVVRFWDFEIAENPIRVAESIETVLVDSIQQSQARPG